MLKIQRLFPGSESITFPHLTKIDKERLEEIMTNFIPEDIPWRRMSFHYCDKQGHTVCELSTHYEGGLTAFVVALICDGSEPKICL